MADVDVLLDKAAIAEAVYRYCRGVDRLDAEMIRSAYHADGYDDHGELKGGVDEFIAELGPLLERKYVSTSHNVCNQLIEIDGDQAHVESYLIASHVTESEDGTQHQEIVFGRYIDRFAKRDGDWRIVHRVVALDGRNVAPVQPSRLATDAKQLARGKRFPDDLIYTTRSLTA